MTSPIVLLKAWNLKPKKQLGQNFLLHPSTAEAIASRASLSSDDVVLEIGAGLGALTIPVARNVKKIYALEKDQQIAELLKTEILVNHISNCEIVQGNILKIDLQTFAENAARKIIVVGNLPYNISSQILVKLIHSRHAVERAIVMFQQELAQRISAQPGSKEYGRITAMLRYCADIRIVANIKASKFYPPPKVDSQVLEIRFKSTSVYGEHDEAMLFKVIKAAFGNRRKTLKNALVASELRLLPQTALQALGSAGIDPSRRAETLEPSEFVSLQISLKKAIERIKESHKP